MGVLAADGVCVCEPSGVEEVEVEVGERSAAGAGASGSLRSSRRSCFCADASAPAPAPGFEVILLMPVFGIPASVPELLEHNIHTHMEQSTTSYV